MSEPLAFDHPNLQRLYDYWTLKCGIRKMPSRDDIDPLDITYIFGNVTLVDVIEGEAPRFRIRLLGTNLAQRAGYELTGKILDELPATEFRTLVEQRWNEVAGSGVALKCGRDAVFDERSYRYKSVILPLSPDGEAVNMLMVALIYDDGT